jgi:hypothetical protein
MLASFLLSLVLTTSSPAHAGKLASGFRSIPFGDPAPLKTAPSDQCIHRPEDTVEWRCADNIGPTPVSINYMVDEEVYYGVYITAKGIQAKEDLMAALKAAWGPSMQTANFEGLWIDRGIYGSLRYNKYSGDVEVIVNSEAATKGMQRRKEERGKSAVNDL